MMVDNELIVLSTVGASPSITGDVMSAATELITDIRTANPSASDKEVLYLLENDLRRSLDNFDNVLLEQLSSNYTGEKAFPCLEAYKIEVAKIGAQFVVCTTANITQPEGLFECIANHSIDLAAAQKTFDSCLATTYPNQPVARGVGMAELIFD